MTDDVTLPYFYWLQDTVAANSLRMHRKSYRKLLMSLYNTEYIWTIDLDVNRAYDGIALRTEYLELFGEGQIDVDIWMQQKCSMFEMLIALSRRMEFQAGSFTSFWFWRLLDNLNLGQFEDSYFDQPSFDRIITRLLKRKYSESGSGGLFPLEYPQEDQRKLEIWFQMHSYILEILHYYDD